MSIIRFIFGILVLFFLAGCSQLTASKSPDFTRRPIQVVATTGMVADAVENIGGERVRVTGLMGPGVDPHLYKPSERTVIALANADMIFYSGLHLEAGMTRVFEKMGDRIITVAIADGIDRDQLHSPPEYEENYDPHVWFDVQMWMDAVKTIETALVELDPAHAEVYHRNAESYLAELAQLHDEVKTKVSRVPKEQRVLITAHDAFNYFGSAYGFEVRGLQGISTVTEAGTGEVQSLVDFIVERRIPAIFIESSVPRRTVEAVQAAVKARGFEVHIGGELFSDAMGSPGTPEGTYIGMVRHNIDTIVSALTNQE
jgi:manganese/zinc/iron transport system substrate-binding protein